MPCQSTDNYDTTPDESVEGRSYKQTFQKTAIKGTLPNQ